MSLQCFFCSDNVPNNYIPPNSDTCFERTLTHDLNPSLTSLFPWITPDLAEKLIPGSFCTKCSVALVNGIWKLQKIKELKSELETIKNELEYRLWGSREQLEGVEAVDNLERVDLKDIALKKRLKFRHVENGRLFFRGQRIIGPRTKLPNSGQINDTNTRHVSRLRDIGAYKKSVLDPNQIRDIALKMSESTRDPRVPPDPRTPPEPAEEFILPDQLTPEDPVVYQSNLDEPGVDQILEPEIKIDQEPQEISLPVVDSNERPRRPRKTPHKLLVDLDLDPLPEDPEEPEPIFNRKGSKKAGDEDEDWEPHTELIKDSLACGILVERDPSVVEESLKSECLRRKPIVLIRRLPLKVKVAEYEREELDWLKKLKVSQRIDLAAARKKILIQFKRVHTWTPQVSCRTCKKKFTGDDREEQLSHHYATVHPKKPYKSWRQGPRCVKCAICGAGFNSQIKLDAHCANIHDPRKFLNPCPYEGCSKSYQNKTFLDTHIKKKHGAQHDYPCTQCEAIFDMKIKLTLHLKNVHKVQPDNICEICGVRLFNPVSLQKHLEYHATGKDDYKCDLCPAKFRFQKGLDTHKILHTGSRIHQCTQCSGTYFTLKKLKYHIKNSHDIVSHPCEICGRVVKDSHLERHRKQLHEKEYNHFCPKSGCNRGYFHRADLRKHLRSHPGTFNYTCRFCPKAYSTAQSRIHHERRTHNKADALQCHICPVTCPTRHQLADHLATHSEEKNWKCSDCGKAFKLKSYLKTHQRRNCKSKMRASNVLEGTGI